MSKMKKICFCCKKAISEDEAIIAIKDGDSPGEGILVCSDQCFKMTASTAVVTDASGCETVVNIPI